MSLQIDFELFELYFIQTFVEVLFYIFTFTSFLKIHLINLLFLSLFSHLSTSTYLWSLNFPQVLMGEIIEGSHTDIKQ